MREQAINEHPTPIPNSGDAMADGPTVPHSEFSHLVRFLGISVEQHASLLEIVAAHQEKTIEEAYLRYDRFSGAPLYKVNNDALPELEKDRKDYPHLLHIENGKYTQNSTKRAEFMSTISGLPIEWCDAWGEKEFVEWADLMDGALAQVIGLKAVFAFVIAVIILGFMIYQCFQLKSDHDVFVAKKVAQQTHSPNRHIGVK